MCKCAETDLVRVPDTRIVIDAYVISGVAPTDRVVFDIPATTGTGHACRAASHTGASVREHLTPLCAGFGRPGGPARG